MIALAAALLVAVGAAAAEGPRVALLVGDDVGFAGEQALRFTGADAERLGTVLEELGGFDRADVRVLKNRTAAEILDAVDELASGPAASVFVFYYSGHADASALHPAGTVLPLDLLLHRLHAVRAELRIGILDACQSGAAARGKGSRPAEPFAVRLDDEASAGDILVSSSAADEQSFESEHGGLFTLHWTAGLRGAADANGDGQVTLGEVYGYAYAQTLRATLAASTGPQHARFRYELEGRRDPVLTRLAGGGLLTLQPQSAGGYVVFDGRERAVVAELPARPGDPRRLALAPGGYVVQLRTVQSLRVARVQLARGDDRVLPEHQMPEVPLVRLARKGAVGERWLTVAGGAFASGLGPTGLLIGSAGLEWEGERWLPGFDLAFSSGSETHQGLETDDLLLQGSGSLLYTMRGGSAALRVGPVAGLGWIRQATQGRPAANGLAVSAGARARGEARISQDVDVFVALDVRALAAPVRDAPPGSGSARLGIEAWGALSLGIRVAF